MLLCTTVVHAYYYTSSSIHVFLLVSLAALVPKFGPLSVCPPASKGITTQANIQVLPRNCVNLANYVSREGIAPIGKHGSLPVQSKMPQVKRCFRWTRGCFVLAPTTAVVCGFASSRVHPNTLFIMRTFKNVGHL